MFHMQLRNLDCINIKEEIKELFPKMEQFVLRGIYEETTRKQINNKGFLRYKNNNTNKAWKKLYHQEEKVNEKYKKYIFHVANILDYVCPNEITDGNKHVLIDNMSKFLAILCRRRGIFLDENHSYVLLLIWNEIGRWRKIEKELLLSKLNSITTFEQKDIEGYINDLWKAGFIYKAQNNYSIKESLVL